VKGLQDKSQTTSPPGLSGFTSPPTDLAGRGFRGGVRAKEIKIYLQN